jgi:hypothetical protein
MGDLALKRRQIAAQGREAGVHFLSHRTHLLEPAPKSLVYHSHSLVEPFVGPPSAFHGTPGSSRSRRLAPAR